MLGNRIVDKCCLSSGSRLFSRLQLKPAFIMLIAMVSLAAKADPSPDKEIIRLLNQQEAQAAYRLAISQLDAWEGDSQFDLAYALAAKAVGELEQAVFAFERVLEMNPDSLQARYFLAVSYFEIGQYTSAQDQFNLLQASEASHEFGSQTSQYLQAIQQRLKSKDNHWQNSIKLAAGFDDNANNGIKDEFIHVPLLGNVRLFEQSREIETAYLDADVQVLYVSPQNQLSAWYAGASVQHIAFDKEQAWERTFYGAVAGYKSKWSQMDWDVNLFYRPLTLDGDAYLDYAGLSANLSYPLSKNSQLGALVSYAIEDYDSLSGLDKDQIIAGVWYSQELNQGMKHRFDLRLGTESADLKTAAHIDRDLWGASYQYEWQWHHQWGFVGKIDYLDSDHKGVEPLFGVQQKAELIRAELQLEYRFVSKWSAYLTLNHMNNSSNLTLYDYDRSKLQMSIKYSF